MVVEAAFAAPIHTDGLSVQDIKDAEPGPVGLTPPEGTEPCAITIRLNAAAWI